jgi:hypothetical protein
MYRKDGFAMHLPVTCIENGGFLCAFGGFYVNSFIFRNKLFAFVRLVIIFVLRDKRTTLYAIQNR